MSLSRRIAAVIAVILEPGYTLGTWLTRMFRNDVHTLRDDEIVSGRRWMPKEHVKLGEIVAWQIFMEMGFDIVVIELADGRSLIRFDTTNDLIDILREVAGERELPWEIA